MHAGPPQHSEDPLSRRQVELATWCQASGAFLTLATLTCSILGTISAQQAIAMALPAAVLILGDLVAASVPGPPTSNRLGFQAGLHVGRLINRWRTLVRHRR